MKDDGGPAFPCEVGYDYKSERVVSAASGMTLRDWFAGQALVGHCANPDWNGKHDVTAQDVYALADAMLAARKIEEAGE